MTTPPDKSPDRITPGKTPEAIEKPAVPKQPANFQSFMEGGPSKSPPGMPGTTGAPSGPTPLDLSRGASLPTGTPTFDSIQSQAKTAQDSLGTVGQQLNEPNLKLKRSQNHLLRNKLSDANQYIRTAGSKLGVDAPPFKMPPGTTGVDRFLAFVNDGQEQLLSVQQKLKSMSASGEQISPGDMMLIQVKMGLAQQEIEYSSTLLGKVIDSIKTIMNIQL